MAVFIKGKLLYLAHTRVASWATTKALCQIGGKYVQTGQSGGGRGHHALFPEVIKYIEYEDEPVVCTVRNHYDALVSWWLKYTREGRGQPDFLLFLKSHLDNSPFIQENRLFSRHLCYADHVLRYESLETDLNTLLERVALPRVKLEHINTTAGKLHYSTYYTTEIKAFVADFFAEELAALGYQFVEVAMDKK